MSAPMTLSDTRSDLARLQKRQQTDTVQDGHAIQTTRVACTSFFARLVGDGGCNSPQQQTLHLVVPHSRSLKWSAWWRQSISYLRHARLRILLADPCTRGILLRWLQCLKVSVTNSVYFVRCHLSQHLSGAAHSSPPHPGGRLPPDVCCGATPSDRQVFCPRSSRDHYNIHTTTSRSACSPPPARPA